MAVEFVRKKGKGGGGRKDISEKMNEVEMVSKGERLRSVAKKKFSHRRRKKEEEVTFRRGASRN